MLYAMQEMYYAAQIDVLVKMLTKELMHIMSIPSGLLEPL